MTATATDDLLHLIVEIKGYRGEDAKEKKSTMETYWVPGVNHLGTMAAGLSPSSPRSIRSRPISRPRSKAKFNKMIDAVTHSRRRKGSNNGQETQPPRRPSKRSRTTRTSGRTFPRPNIQSVVNRSSRSPVRVAYERRNRDLDPQLVWRGKDEQDWSDLVVHAPPLYIQEKVHPKVLIDDLLRQIAGSEERAKPRQAARADLFADFNGIPKGADKTEFYQHDQNWSNRMILGDSLQVMASLAEREGLRGKVQCIYLDPPYGIKFNSNFQWSTTSRDVKDGKTDHITREPEQVKAFRDTWRDGIHSYLTYLRDRLTVARDLLTESGSIFVQIGDENVHRVRAVMDEVFGDENFVSRLSCRQRRLARARRHLWHRVLTIILWYREESASVQIPPALSSRKSLGDEEPTSTCSVFRTRRIERKAAADEDVPALPAMPTERRSSPVDNLTSSGEYATADVRFPVRGRALQRPASGVWKTHELALDSCRERTIRIMRQYTRLSSDS